MRTCLKKEFLSFIFSLSLLPLAAQVKIYVATNGNDKNSGSITRPFQTLHHAIKIAAAQKSKEVILSVREGVYPIGKTIIIDAATLQAASLKITAYNNEKVVISAGKKLSLKWKPYKNGIFSAAIPAGHSFEGLYINQKLQTLARYPNYDSSARIFNGTAEDAFSPQRIQGWKNPAGAYVHALHAYEWGGFHYLVKGVSASGVLELEGGWQNNRPNEMHEEHRFIENVFEELDTAGEWWLDRNKNILYFYPPARLDLSSALVEVSQLKNSIELRGHAQHPLRNVSIENLEFAHNERSFMETREPLLRSDWTIYRGGAILLDGTEDCSISACVFEGIGGNAVFFSNYNRNDTVRACHIYNTGANAICFIGDTKAARSGVHGHDNYLPYKELDTTAGPLGNNFPQHCVAENNLIHNVGILEKQATGVQIQVASGITVRHNSIYNTSRAGINIGDGSFGGHVLEFNDVFNTVRETGDHGSFNSWGRDRFWAHRRDYMDSLVTAHPELITLDAQQQTIIRNNRFRCDHGWDIDLDDGSTNYYIYNNLCLNGGIKLREGFNRIVENNIMVNNSFHPHVWFKNSGDIFRRNIVMKEYAPIRVNDWGTEIDHNFFPDTVSLHAAQANGTDKNSLYGTVSFVDPTAGDFTVTPGNAALKTGFKNFSMTAFGVQDARLKKVALQPAMPTLITSAGLSDKSVEVPFLGGTVKSVNGLGDRSAHGLPDETGVIIVGTGDNSPLQKAGLQTRDVIRTAGGKPVADVKQLLDIYQMLNWTGEIHIAIIRDQQVVQLTLKTK